MERKTKNNDLNTLALPQAVFFLILVVFFFFKRVNFRLGIFAR